MDNVNDIIDMLKDLLADATRKTNRIKEDVYEKEISRYSFSELVEAESLEDQARNILYTITGKVLYWLEVDERFIEVMD